MIGEGETQSMAESAMNHFERTGMPLRLAIDEANWRFKALTDAMEVKIKAQSPGSHPREKRILERISYLLSINVQLVFVFDGPNKDKPARGGILVWSVGRGSSFSVERLISWVFHSITHQAMPRPSVPGCRGLEQLMQYGRMIAILSCLDVAR